VYGHPDVCKNNETKELSWRYFLHGHPDVCKNNKTKELSHTI
jgi:hypothetical protein